MFNLLREAWQQLEDPLTFFPRARNKLFSLWLRTTYPFASIGTDLSIRYPCSLRRPAAKHIRLGNSVIIGEDSLLYIVQDNPTGVKLEIDDNCAIGARSTISAMNHIHIEQNVITATSVLIQDHNHAYEDVNVPIRAQGVTSGGQIRIEQGCWIGKGAAIVCNQGDLVIGRNSVVGANALVTKSVPPYSVIVGNPGRIARRFDSDKGIWIGGETGRAMPIESVR